MLAVRNDDQELSREAGKLPGARVRNNGNGQLGNSTCHGADMLQRKRPGAAVQRAGDAFDRHVGPGAIY